MKIKLVKIKELEDAISPNNKLEGYEKYGEMIGEPAVGKCFYLAENMGYFRTSMVTKIIDKDTFRTQNSIYKIIR